MTLHCPRLIVEQQKPTIEQVWLAHPEEVVCAAFRDHSAGLPGVRVVRGRFADLPPDCFVTACYSLGLVTSGLDAAVVRPFGGGVMRRVRHRVLDQFLGEQSVEATFVLDTGHRASRSWPGRPSRKTSSGGRI